MTLDEFNQQVNRMIEVWGSKAFPKERLKLIYSEVKQLSETDFASLVSDLIGNYKFAPVMDDFRERAYKIKDRLDRRAEQVERRDLESRVMCDECFDGIVSGEDHMGYAFAFRCYCPLGRTRRESWPIWDSNSGLRNRIKGLKS